MGQLSKISRYENCIVLNLNQLKVVEACAPRGIHVMVEKPLAVSVDHAKTMSKLAEKIGILLLTNYETSWYPSNYKGYKMISEGALGELRKIIVYDGHKGPEEINVNIEFFTAAIKGETEVAPGDLSDFSSNKYTYL